ncbi:MAG TPA: hypothetical protein VJL60_06525 [Gammaproteobacteria bacterium]|nr:hypothetical protein [Gammaproteobacteria bacterium]
MIFLNEILPDEISDEAAYEIVEILQHLAVAVESYYYGKIKRHISDISPLNIDPKYLRKTTDEDDSF